MQIYFDGSCGPKNPGGKACYGFVIYQDGQEIHRGRGKECEGPSATNNVAEYSGLKHALKHLIKENQKGPIEILGDSNLVVCQVNKVWKCKKEHLQEYLDEIHTMLNEFESWTAKWVPREQNSIADTLSKVTPDD